VVVDCDPTIPESKPATVPAPPGDVAVIPVPSADFARLPNVGATERGRGSINPKVFSGAIFERGSVVLRPGITRVVVPETAAVAYGAPAATIELFVEKSLGFAGHPPAPMPAAGLQRNMGCATHTEGSDLVLATFGEWDSHIEGSASLELFVRVPIGTTVVRRVGLEGDESAAVAWPESVPYEKQEAGRVGYWYAPTNPIPGFTAVPLRADSQRIARAAPEHPKASSWRRPHPVTDELDVAVVKRAVACVVARSKPATLDRCRREDPQASGWFEVAWEIREDGSTTIPASYVGPLKNTTLADCVRKDVARWSFPRRARGSYFERFELGPATPE
jgi:hypothetical protein